MKGQAHDFHIPNDWPNRAPMMRLRIRLGPGAMDCWVRCEAAASAAGVGGWIGEFSDEGLGRLADAANNCPGMDPAEVGRALLSELYERRADGVWSIDFSTRSEWAAGASARTEQARKAGRASAAARLAKFGTAVPGTVGPEDFVTVAGKALFGPTFDPDLHLPRPNSSSNSARTGELEPLGLGGGRRPPVVPQGGTEGAAHSRPQKPKRPRHHVGRMRSELLAAARKGAAWDGEGLSHPGLRRAIEAECGSWRAFRLLNERDAGFAAARAASAVNHALRAERSGRATPEDLALLAPNSSSNSSSNGSSNSSSNGSSNSSSNGSSNSSSNGSSNSPGNGPPGKDREGLRKAGRAGLDAIKAAIGGKKPPKGP